MIETNHNISGENDKISQETNGLSVNGDVQEEGLNRYLCCMCTRTVSLCGHQVVFFCVNL